MGGPHRPVRRRRRRTKRFRPVGRARHILSIARSRLHREHVASVLRRATETRSRALARGGRIVAACPPAVGRHEQPASGPTGLRRHRRVPCDQRLSPRRPADSVRRHVPCRRCVQHRAEAHGPAFRVTSDTRGTPYARGRAIWRRGRLPSRWNPGFQNRRQRSRDGHASGSRRRSPLGVALFAWSGVQMFGPGVRWHTRPQAARDVPWAKSFTAMGAAPAT